MASERVIRITHTVLFTLLLLAAIVSLAISASLVAHYNSEGYPPVHTKAYRDRIRIVLVAGVWTTGIGIILTVGFQTLGKHRAFGILAHLAPLLVSFILFIIGTASLTALTNGTDCSRSGEGFERCGIVKGLVVVGWIDTIFILLALIFVGFLAFKAHRGYGAKSSTLYVD